MLKLKLHIIIWLGFVPLGISAQDKLDEYLSMAALNNPALKATFNAYMAALEKAPQVSTLPDPQIAFAYFIQPIETRNGPQEFKFSASQMFPWFGTLKAKENEAIAIAEARYERFKEEKSKLFQEVKSNWYNIYFNTKATTITEDNINILNTFKKLANTKVEAGLTSAVDLYRIQLEINDLQNQLAQLNDKQIQLEISFKNLVSMDEGQTLIRPDSLKSSYLPLAKSVIWDSVKIKNHQLIAINMEASALSYRKNVAQKSGSPSINLGIDYAVIGKGENQLSGKDAILFPKVGLSIPLYRKKYKSMVQEVVYLETAKNYERLSKIDVLENLFEKTWTEYSDAQRRINLYAEQSHLAHKALRLLETEYAHSSKNFEELLRLERRLLKYQLELEKANTDNLASVAFLDYLMGK